MTNPHMQADANILLVQRLIEEGWNQGNVDGVDELVAADYVNHDLWPNVYLHASDEAPDRDQIKADIPHFRATFPTCAS